jgi:eukaryotic-like serine/threonine-protein kinase
MTLKVKLGIKLKVLVLVFTLPTLFFTVFSQTTASVPDFRELPKLKWAFGIDSPFYASPIVNGNSVYIGGLDSLLHVLDLESGLEKWSFRTNGEIRSNICLDGDFLYLNGGDGKIYALNIQTRQLLWTFKTEGERKYDFADYFHSTPVIQNGILYFGSGDRNFYAINAGNGNLIWTFRTGDVIHTTPSIADGKVYFGSFDGYVYTLNLSNGNLIWKFKTVGHRYFPKGEVQGSPAVFKDLVFIGARDFNVYALDQKKGYCHWNKSFTNGWGLCCNIHDSVLYIGSADERHLISANPITGAESWNKPMEFLVFGNNAYTDSMLIIGTTIGKLHGISLKTGEKVWSYETDSYQKAKLKYFKPDDSYRNDIFSIIKSNEQFLEVEEELGGIFSTPCIAGDLIVFSSTYGKVYCLKR